MRSTVASSTGMSATMRPPYITAMRSESWNSSSRSSLISSTRAAARPQVEELAVDELGGADIDAARRLGGEQDLRLVGDLAGEQRLLQVAAGERAGARVGTGGADVEAVDLVAGELADRLAVEDAAPGERRPADPGQRHAFRQRQRADHADRHAVLRHAADAARLDEARGQAGHHLAVEFDGAAGRGKHAGDHVGERPLAVAGDAGDADDLAGAKRQRHVLEAGRRRHAIER